MVMALLTNRLSIVIDKISGQMMLWEDSTRPHNVSRSMSLILGARRHLEWGHEKYVNDTIQSHPAQVLAFLTL